MRSLYVKARHLGYQRGKHLQTTKTSIVQLEGVNSAAEAEWYLGKRVAFVYRAQRKQDGTHSRTIYGKVTRTHGNSGSVRAKFTTALPPKSFGASLRVVLPPPECSLVSPCVSVCRCCTPPTSKGSRVR